MSHLINLTKGVIWEF